MSHFGNTLFSGNPLIRWTLVPVLVVCVILFGVVLVGAVLARDIVPILVSLVLTVGCLSMAIALIFPRCEWAFRLVTGLVFGAYLFYVIYEWGFDQQEGIGLQSGRSEANPRNALLGFIIIGLPCLWYTVLGRFTLRPQNHLKAESLDDTNHST